MTQTVIIVDDNVLCARLYKALLEPLACRVLLARTAEEAARVLGTAATADMDDQPDHGSAPRPLFLVGTPYQAEPVQQVARIAGGDALFLNKPMARDSLAGLVRRHISAHH